jgi:hypothetical protein
MVEKKDVNIIKLVGVNQRATVGGCDRIDERRESATGNCSSTNMPLGAVTEANGGDGTGRGNDLYGLDRACL